MNEAKKTIKQLLEPAGVKLNGSDPWDIQINDERIYRRVLRHRELGLAEAYMDGWWDCRQIDEMAARLINAKLRSKLRVTPTLVWYSLTPYLGGRQSVKRAKANASHHYNIGNDLYSRMLDKRMIYSCGYWQDAKNLDEAQTTKLDLICRKLHLKKGMKLLDIGCGWGGFAAFAAEKYGVEVTGISPAIEQVKLAQSRVEGLSVKIKQADYRTVSGKFDRIVSIGMLEHVGKKNYTAFFDACERLLTPDGLMLHHMIGHHYNNRTDDAFTQKYIFPGGHIPSLSEILKGKGRRFIIEDLHNFGPDYDKTLMAWNANFNKHWSEIKDSYDERFKRMWNYYLLTCAAAFRARELQLWQIVMRPETRSKTYQSIR